MTANYSADFFSYCICNLQVYISYILTFVTAV